MGKKGPVNASESKKAPVRKSRAPKRTNVWKKKLNELNEQQELKEQQKVSSATSPKVKIPPQTVEPTPAPTQSTTVTPVVEAVQAVNIDQQSLADGNPSFEELIAVCDQVKKDDLEKYFGKNHDKTIHDLHEPRKSQLLLVDTFILHAQNDANLVNANDKRDLLLGAMNLISRRIYGEYRVFSPYNSTVYSGYAEVLEKFDAKMRNDSMLRFGNYFIDQKLPEYKKYPVLGYTVEQIEQFIPECNKKEEVIKPKLEEAVKPTSSYSFFGGFFSSGSKPTTPDIPAPAPANVLSNQKP